MGAALLHALLLLMIAMLLRADASTSGSVGSVAHGHAVLSTAVSDGAPRARAEMRPCAWTAPDGSLYDLSALARLGGQEDYRVNIPHSNFAMLVNLCANTLRVPTRCAGPSNTRASVGFQWDTSNDASCWELGSLDTAQWDLLDEHDPRKGVEIMFTGGTACSSGMARMVHFHMLCAEGVGDEGTILRMGGADLQLPHRVAYDPRLSAPERWVVGEVVGVGRGGRGWWCGCAGLAQEPRHGRALSRCVLGRGGAAARGVRRVRRENRGRV